MKITVFICNLLLQAIFVKAAISNMDSRTSTSQAYNIINSLPRNYVKDGSVDYTTYIQQAINNHRYLLFPPFPILVNDKGLAIPSHTRIEFLKGSKLILMASSNQRYYIINLNGSTNVELINPTIVGDRYVHRGTQGQWGYGIGIFSAKDIVIENPTIKNCWGDGIGIARDPKIGITSKNIVIKNAYIENCRRNGISIISVDGLKLINPYIRNAFGHSPESGIDIEPDGPRDVLRNISIDSPITENNKGDGILMYFVNFYGNKNQQVDIRITNHRDKGSANGARIISYKSEKNPRGIITGNITYSQPVWQDNSKRPLDARHLNESNLNFIVNGAMVKKSNQPILSKLKSKELILKSISTKSRSVIY